ncbi:MAG: hypothetical protein QHC67_13305 [Sphingobium sp.]|uniref:hypothetical protein n=1 Tax=Sphingobium sp. TaxID=1912891 RepID=UPI0029BB304E|nr:hypothetical protein [Sphingobium sp.]MDX3910777.1 hypothetical protein [Sphingobium sp.]
MRMFLALVLLSFAQGAAAETASPLTPREAQRLEKALAGKVPGTPVNCVPRTMLNDLQTIGNGILLYRVGTKLTYRNDLGGQCGGLRSDDIPVFQSFGGSYCKGDFVRVVDRLSGNLRGSCVLGPFVPYSAPAR